jgi:hypothetical protein
MRVRVSTVAALALVLAIVAALPAHAAPRSSRQAEQAGLFSRLVGFVGNLPGRLVAAWGKAGSAIDPFGGTTPPAQGSASTGGNGGPLQ